MSSKTGVVYTCAHADPDVPNDRATWLGEFLYDIKPDFVMNLGDAVDMRSLNSYDTRYPQAIVSQNYGRDIECGLDFEERVRHKFKKNKVKLPTFYKIQGNHEYRIDKAIQMDPRLEGEKYGVSTKHLQEDYFFNEYHPYQYGAPPIVEYDGILYSHFIGSGNYGTAMSGEHHAYNLLKKKMKSTIVGHSHKRNIYFRDDAKAIGLVAGCFKGGKESWAGQANDDWASGVWVMRCVESGMFDPQWVSLEALSKAYDDPKNSSRYW